MDLDFTSLFLGDERLKGRRKIALLFRNGILCIEDPSEQNVHRQFNKETI